MDATLKIKYISMHTLHIHMVGAKKGTTLKIKYISMHTLHIHMVEAKTIQVECIGSTQESESKDYSSWMLWQ